MTVTRIDQLVPVLASRDAIGNHVMQVQSLLREGGIDSDIYYCFATDDRLADGFPIGQIDRVPSAGRALLYHLAIGSGASLVFHDRPEHKIVNYHNITPWEFLDQWAPAMSDLVWWGRQQLRDLAEVTDFAIADSEYNRRELVDAGYAKTTTAPPLVDLDGFGGQPDRQLLDRLTREKAEGGADLLFVGKISPHKGQEDLIKSFAVYREVYDPRARLRLVGSPMSEEYQVAVDRFIAGLGLHDAVRYAGSVTHEELIAHYINADAFVCVSNHEGFCVPLIEAMYHAVPVVTHDCSAIPETVGTAGLVLPDKDPYRVAAAVDRVVRDQKLRDCLRVGARVGVERFALARVRERWLEAIADACPGGVRT